MNRPFSLYQSILALSLILVATLFATDMKAKPIANGQKSILVTGASTGNGRLLAETLATKGYFVYAGARKDKDLKALNAIKNIQSSKRICNNGSC